MKKILINLLIVVLVAILSFGAGFFVGGSLEKEVSQEKNVSNSSGDNSKEIQEAFTRGKKEGLDDAWKRLKTSGYNEEAEVGLVSSFSGKIVSVEGENSISVLMPSLNPLAEKEANTRTVIIDNSTLLFIITKKSEKEYQDELSLFLSKGESVVEDAPSRFKKTSALASDLRPDQNLSLTVDLSSADEHEELLAKEITINYRE